MNRFATIVADPPWQVGAGRAFGPYTAVDGKQVWVANGSRSRQLPYPSMSVDEIAAMAVLPVAADDAHLFLWTINKYLPDAFRIVKAWGFEYSTTLVWAKNPMGGGMGGTFGISTEYCLFCRRGRLATRKDVNSTWFNWKRPYDERGKPRHSAKPEAFMEMVEQVSPGPYLEIFARSNRPGWTAWGNECESADLDLLGVFA